MSIFNVYDDVEDSFLMTVAPEAGRCHSARATTAPTKVFMPYGKSMFGVVVCTGWAAAARSSRNDTAKY